MNQIVPCPQLAPRIQLARWLLLPCLASVLLGGGAGAAGTRFLRSVSAVERGGRPEFAIEFDAAVRYLRLTSAGSRAGSSAIEIAVLDLDSGHESLGAIRESLRLAASEGLPAIEVVFEGGSTDLSTVVLNADRPVRFAVRQGANANVLHVEVEAEPGVDGERARSLLDEARKSMTAGEIDRAILLYGAVLSLPRGPYTPEAMELLGLARERNGQLAQAVAQYRAYLEEYPEGEGVGRVGQRLAVLITASDQGARPLRPRSTEREAGGLDFEGFGSVSTYYSRAERFVGSESQVLGSSQIVNLDLNGRLTTRRLKLRGRASGTYRYDYFEKRTGNGSRVSTLELEVASRDVPLRARLGRLRRIGSGVLGRLDGGRVAYSVHPQWDVRAFGGFLSQTFEGFGVDTERPLAGVSVGFVDIAEVLDGEVYGIYQRVGDQTDRAAIGGELRYQGREGLTAVGYVDFDVVFASLNIIRVLGNWQANPNLDLNVLGEYRNSPFLTASNALIGSGVDSMDALEATLSASEIRALARRRTARTGTFSIGGSYRFLEDYRVTGSFGLNDYSGTKELDYRDASGLGFSYLAQVVAYDLLVDGEADTLGVRIFDGRNADTYSIFVNNRYPLTPRLRLNPGLRFDYRDADRIGDSYGLRPSVRLDYRLGPAVLDVQATYQWQHSLSGALSGSAHLYTLDVGVRYDF